MKLLEKLSETLHHIGTIIFKECLRLTEDEDPEQARVSFKMVIFLILFFIWTIGKRHKKKSKLDLLDEATGKGAKKKKNKAES